MVKMNRCFLVTASAWGARGIAIIGNFLNLCLLLNFLGTDSYAIAAVILSMKGWFTLADFGVGVSLQNYVSESIASNQDIKDLLRTACQSCFVILAVLVLLVFLFSNFCSSFFHLDQISSEYNIFLLVSLSFIFLSLGSVVYKVFYALQKGYWAHIFQLCADLLGAIGVFLVTKNYTGENKLFFALLPLTAIPACTAFTVFLVTFLKSCPIRDLFFLFSKGWIKQIFYRGVPFWIFSLMNASILFIDYLVAAKTLCSQEIVRYNILEKGFNAVFYGYSSFLMAMHPKCTELFTKGQVDLMKSVIHKTYIIGCFVFPPIIFCGLYGFSYFSPYFFKETITFELSTLCLASVYMILRIVCDTYSIALQSISKLRCFFYLMPAQIIINLAIQYYGAQTIGLNGIYLGLISSIILTVAWALPTEFYKVTNRHKAFGSQIA